MELGTELPRASRVVAEAIHPIRPQGRLLAIPDYATDQRRAIEEIELLSRAVEQTADSVVIANRQGEITYVNPAFEQTTGYSRREVIGLTPRVLKSGAHDTAFYERMWATVLSGKPFRCTLRNRKKNGDLYWAEQTIAPIVGETGEITHFVAVLKDITESRQQQEQQIRMRLARDVQQRFYSRTAGIPGLDIGRAIHPAEQTGGDYVDFIKSPDDGNDALGVAIGDVGGHGFDAALVMALTRAYVRSFWQQGLGPGKVLNAANRILVPDIEDNRMVTLLLAHVDLSNHVLTYANAGHVPGFVLGTSGEVEATLDSTGVPLGIFECHRFGTKFLRLEPGQVVVLMTDGATEAGEPDDFGLCRVIEYAQAHRDEPAQQVAEGLYAAICEHAGAQPAKDDISLVVLKVE